MDYSLSHEVQVIARLAARELRSHLGSNLRLLRDRTGCDPWTVSRDDLKMRLRHTDPEMRLSLTKCPEAVLDGFDMASVCKSWI